MQIPETAPDRIVEIAHFTARSRSNPSTSDFAGVLEAGDPYTKRVINSAITLGFIERLAENRYKYAGPSELTNSGLDGHPHLFRLQLQSFLPFLYFAFWISAGDTAAGAARKTCVEFDISNSSESVRRTFYRWGKYGQVLKGSSNSPVISASEWTLATLGFIDKLRKSLDEELSAKLFTMSCLGADVASELNQRSVPFLDIADCLRIFENDPRVATDRSTQAVESLLASMFRDTLANHRLPAGVGQLIQALKSSDIVTSRHVDIVKGLGSLRNAAEHAVDRDTGKPWEVSVEGALAAILLTIVTLRSVVKYKSNLTQVL